MSNSRLNQKANSSLKTSLTSPRQSFPKLSLPRSTSSVSAKRERRLNLETSSSSTTTCLNGLSNSVRKSGSFTETTARRERTSSAVNAEKISPRFSISSDEKIRVGKKESERQEHIDVRQAWAFKCDDKLKHGGKNLTNNLTNNLNSTRNDSRETVDSLKPNIVNVQGENKKTDNIELINSSTVISKEQNEPKQTKSLSKWSVLRTKLLQNVESEDEEIESKTKDEDEKDAISIDDNIDKQSSMYWKILRQRLRKCEPAEIIASSDVGEIQKRRERKEILERRRSYSSASGKGSRFFHTVMQAQALTKERSTITGRYNKTSSLGIFPDKTSSPTHLKRESLPDISPSVKCSAHFHRTLKSLGREKNDLFIEDEER